jgi:hypothetical protein
MFSKVLLAAATVVSPAVGLVVMGPHHAATVHSNRRTPLLAMTDDVPKIDPPNVGQFPFRAAVLGLVAVQSAFGLVSERELAGLASGMDNIDAFGTVVDAAFVAYSTSTLLRQAGLIQEAPGKMSTTLDGMECQVSMNVGREQGTWMPSDWAVSGARLSLPLVLRFSDELVDLGVPGEESLNGGGRYAKRLYCDGGQFVGAQGAQVVACSGGAWATEASPIPGARSLNFFLDFPHSATRNDVSLPAGRVFFSCACWQSREDLPAGIVDGEVMMPDGEAAGVVEGPGGSFVLAKGGLTIKRNDWRNLWGSLGDVMLILGRFSFAEKAPSGAPATAETPIERAARERAEDAAKGRKL